MKLTAVLAFAAGLVAVQAQNTDPDFCGRQYVASNGCSYNVTCGFRVPRRFKDPIYSSTAIGLLKCTDKATSADPAVLCTDFDENTQICEGFTTPSCLSTRAKGRFYKMAQQASCPTGDGI